MSADGSHLGTLTAIAPPATPKPKIEILDSVAIFAPLEEPDYLVDGIVRRGSLVELVAYGGSGKTWLADDLAVAVASGTPWLGRFLTKQGRSLILDYENGSYESRRRIQAVTRGRGIASVDGIGLAAMPAVYANDPVFQSEVQRAAEGRALVILDTLKAANPGVDENDSNMRVGLDALRRVGETTGCAFLVLVHGKKTGGNQSGTIDPREQGRGSSAIFDAADTVLHVAYAEGRPLMVRQTKSRQGRSIAPFQVEIIDSPDGGVICRSSDLPSAETSASRDFQALCDRVLRVLKDHPGSTANTVVEFTNAKRPRVLAALEMLHRHGAARWQPAPRNGQAWFLVERDDFGDVGEDAF